MTQLTHLNGTKLLLVLIVGVVGMTFALLFRAHQTAVTDRQLCDVLHDIIAQSGATLGRPGSPGYAYYSEHPDELRAARAQNRQYLAQLDCKNLPSGG